jgi:hypothetical protein
MVGIRSECLFLGMPKKAIPSSILRLSDALYKI